MQKGKEVDNNIQSISHSLNNLQTKLAWYGITGDNQYLKSCNEWYKIAGYYLDQLNQEKQNETCESRN